MPLEESMKLNGIGNSKENHGEHNWNEVQGSNFQSKTFIPQ